MRGLFPLLLVSLASPAAAQTVVVSPAPQATSVTIYRAPYRDADDAIDRDDPAGFALVTETRTITLPPGPAVIRFEGVAGNILPESAIVAGLPGDVAEKNLDADLLSPRTLYDRALGRRILFRRTDPATGRVREEQAVIRSSAAGAAVLQVAGGYEALRCSGLPETIVHDAVPDGLSAKPTLSVATTAGRGGPVTVTLSYLAGGFDWQADYVVTLRPDGRSADLFAWVTLASSDVTSFADAQTQVIAGRPNREETPSFGQFNAGALQLRCWPTNPRYGRAAPPPPPPLPPPPPPMAAPPPPAMALESDAANIIVTGARRVQREELGDFKLYRVPQPVTVASKAQKQVALLAQDGVPLRLVYVTDVDGESIEETRPVLRARNRVADGLGLPLPAGQVAVFQTGGPRPILVGESATADKAIDEEIEFKLAETPQVSADLDVVEQKKRTARLTLTVTNANPWPVAYEARFAREDGVRLTADARLMPKDGRLLWSTTVPANGTARLRLARRTKKA